MKKNENGRILCVACVRGQEQEARAYVVCDLGGGLLPVCLEHLEPYVSKDFENPGHVIYIRWPAMKGTP